MPGAGCRLLPWRAAGTIGYLTVYRMGRDPAAAHSKCLLSGCGSSLIQYGLLSIIRLDRAYLETRPAARPTQTMLQSTRIVEVRPPVALVDSLLLVAEHHPEAVRVVIRSVEPSEPLGLDASERSRRPRRGASRSRS